MGRYTKGYKRELAAKRVLEGMGYEVVRSAGSHGPWDLVAYKDGEVRFIQVKSTPPIKRLKERLEAYPKISMKPSYEIWVWKKREGFDIFASGGRTWTLSRSLTRSETQPRTSKGSKKNLRRRSRKSRSTG